jgi:hypothetical protein
MGRGEASVQASAGEGSGGAGRGGAGRGGAAPRTMRLAPSMWSVRKGPRLSRMSET